MGRPANAVFGMLSILRVGIEACLETMCCEFAGVLLLAGVADRDDEVRGVVSNGCVAWMVLFLEGPCCNRDAFPGEEFAVAVPWDAVVAGDGTEPSDEKRNTVAVWPDLLVVDVGICISCLEL
jgi:hypothetical protein